MEFRYLTDAVIVFARSLKTCRAPCYNLVSRWLIKNNVENVPSDTIARRWWYQDGPEKGLSQAAEKMRLRHRVKPCARDVAVISQGKTQEPILGLIAENGFCVVRSFGVLVVSEAKILRSWGMPWGE